MIVGGTCWHSLMVLAQMCDICGLLEKQKGVSTDFPDSKGNLSYFHNSVIYFDMLKNNKSILHQLTCKK